MADDEVTPLTTTTTNYSWVKPDVGASNDAWGDMLNADLDGIDSVVHGVQTSVPAASSSSPLMDGTAAAGTGTTWARADHVHPSDTTKLGLSGGTLTGALTLSSTAGIVGTTTNDNANAGAVGEVISSNVTSPVSLSTTIPANVTSISLTAGDWDVSGEVWFAIGVGGAGQIIAAINTVTAALPAASALATAQARMVAAFTASSSQTMALRACRVSLASATTYYLVAIVVFPSGACTATGNIIARRAR